MTNNNNNVIAINTDTAGAISYWRLAGATSRAALALQWLAVGLDEALLPANPSNEVALRRAVTDQEGKDQKAFRIKGNKDFNGWGVVEVSTKDGHVSTTEIMRARLDGDNIVVETQIEGLAARTEQAFAMHKGALAAADISGWLIKLASGKAATSLRESGGVYFVPRQHTDFWTKVATALQGCGDHKVFRIPAMQTREAIEAILDSVTQEAERLITDVNSELQASEIGERALTTRKTRCDEMLAKIRSYENLLGVKMAALQAKVEGLAVNVVSASLAA